MYDELNSTIIWNPGSEDVLEIPDAGLEQIQQKHKNDLLRIIYDNDGISNAELAKKLGISASGLNAVVKKVNEVIDPPISAERVKKFKFYTLTSSGRRYVENHLLCDFQHTERELKRLWDLLCRRNGEECGAVVLRFLKSDRSVLTNDEEGTLVSDMIEIFREFYERERNEAWKMLCRVTENRVVSEAVLKHVVESNHFSADIGMLNKMCEQDWEKIYRVIDGIFDGMAEESQTGENIWDGESFYRIFPIMNTLQAKFLQAIIQNEQKNEVRNELISYGLDGRLAYHISEKYGGLLAKLQRIYEEKYERRCGRANEK